MCIKLYWLGPCLCSYVYDWLIDISLYRINHFGANIIRTSLKFVWWQCHRADSYCLDAPFFLSLFLLPSDTTRLLTSIIILSHKELPSLVWFALESFLFFFFLFRVTGHDPFNRDTHTQRERERREEKRREKKERMGENEGDVSMEPEAAAPAGPSSSTSSSIKRPKRFEIKKWNAVALWAWGASFHTPYSLWSTVFFVLTTNLCKLPVPLWFLCWKFVLYIKDLS